MKEHLFRREDEDPAEYQKLLAIWDNPYPNIASPYPRFL
jgi:hypothetical protein